MWCQGSQVSMHVVRGHCTSTALTVSPPHGFLAHLSVGLSMPWDSKFMEEGHMASAPLAWRVSWGQDQLSAALLSLLGDPGKDLTG